MNDPVGIIGLGLVGSVIADLLAESGRTVIGYDTGEARTDKATLVNSAALLCHRCRTVILSLPNSQIVGSVLQELEGELTPQHLIVDTSTGDPQDAIAHEATLTLWQTAFIEAKIAGSSDLLRQCRAGIFLGGNAQTIARVQPILDILTRRCFHLGDIGAASRFKLVFNLMLGLHRAALAETLHFGQALGFDPADTLEVLQASPAASLVMETKGPKMAHAADDPPQARLSQHLKDVRLMLAEAERSGARLALSQAHEKLLEEAAGLGFGELDTAAVFEAYPSLQAK